MAITIPAAEKIVFPRELQFKIPKRNTKINCIYHKSLRAYTLEKPNKYQQFRITVLIFLNRKCWHLLNQADRFVYQRLSYFYSLVIALSTCLNFWLDQ